MTNVRNATREDNESQSGDSADRHPLVVLAEAVAMGVPFGITPVSAADAYELMSAIDSAWGSDHSRQQQEREGPWVPLRPEEVVDMLLAMAPISSIARVSPRRKSVFKKVRAYMNSIDRGFFRPPLSLCIRSALTQWTGFVIDTSPICMHAGSGLCPRAVCPPPRSISRGSHVVPEPRAFVLSVESLDLEGVRSGSR